MYALLLMNFYLLWGPLNTIILVSLLTISVCFLLYIVNIIINIFLIFCLYFFVIIFIIIRYILFSARVLLFCCVFSRPKEFTECVAHMRLLSWLLLGSLTHSALCGGGVSGENWSGLRLHGPGSHPAAQPVPQEASCHIADHVQVI